MHDTTGAVRSNSGFINSAQRAIDTPKYGIGVVKPYYQPQVNIITGKIGGTEVLFRFSPYPPSDRAQIRRPDEIFPEASPQEMGMFDADIRQAVVDRLRSWLREGIAVPIGINVSPGMLDEYRFQLELPWLLTDRAASGDKQNIDPKYLMLEISEAVNIAGLQHQAEENLLWLAEKGFPLVLDDIGTGYSTAENFALARQRFGVTFNAGKLDKSYFGEGRYTGADEVRDVMHAFLRHNPDMGFVVEGVETRKQLDEIVLMRAKEFPSTEILAQSFLTGRPMEVEVLELLLRPRR